MKNNALFQDLPLVGLITNFGTNGEFEKIYMLTADRKKQPGSRERRKPVPVNRTWNGPNLEKMVEKWNR